MKRRLIVEQDCTLREKDGTPVGRIVELVIELEEADMLGGGRAEQSQQIEIPVDIPLELSKTSHSSQKRKTEIDEVWAEYQACFPKKRVKLDDKLRRIISKALDVRDVAQCKLAVRGLSKDPWCSEHKPRPYDSIGYALSAIGRESIEERIDRMAAQAEAFTNPGAAVPPELREMVETRKRQVEVMLLKPGDANARARAGNAQEELANRHGLRATVVVGTPPPGAYFIVVGGVPRYIRWDHASTAAPGEGS